MNKKIKECENIEFLPQKFQDELKEQSDKNILSTLCYFRFRFSDYALANNGFFFTSLEELSKESLVDVSTVKRRLALMQMKKYIERKSGTNHQCTHYKLSKEIEELLGIEEEENSANEPLDKISKDKLSLDKKSSVKLSLDETSQVESRQDNLRIEKEKMSLNSIENNTFTIQTFQNEVEPLLECKYEDELINKKLDIIKNLNTKRLEIGESMYNRCLSYLNRKYSKMCEVVQADASTVDELPF